MVVEEIRTVLKELCLEVENDLSIVNGDIKISLSEKEAVIESENDLLNVVNILNNKAPIWESEKLDKLPTINGFINCNMKFVVLPSIFGDNIKEGRDC